MRSVQLIIILLSCTTFQWPLQQCIQSYFFFQSAVLKYCGGRDKYSLIVRGQVGSLLKFVNMPSHHRFTFCCLSPFFCEIIFVSTGHTASCQNVLQSLIIVGFFNICSIYSMCTKFITMSWLDEALFLCDLNHMSLFFFLWSNITHCLLSSLFNLFCHSSQSLISSFSNQCRSQLILHSRTRIIRDCTIGGYYYCEWMVCLLSWGWMSLSSCLRLNSCREGQLSKMIFG